MSSVQVLSQLVAAGGDRQGLGAWCLEVMAPVLAASAGTQRLIVNLAQDNPLPELYPGESL